MESNRIDETEIAKADSMWRPRYRQHSIFEKNQKYTLLLLCGTWCKTQAVGDTETTWIDKIHWVLKLNATSSYSLQYTRTCLHIYFVGMSSQQNAVNLLWNWCSLLWCFTWVETKGICGKKLTYTSPRIDSRFPIQIIFFLFERDYVQISHIGTIQIRSIWTVT